MRIVQHAHNGKDGIGLRGKRNRVNSTFDERLADARKLALIRFLLGGPGYELNATHLLDDITHAREDVDVIGAGESGWAVSETDGFA